MKRQISQESDCDSLIDERFEGALLSVNDIGLKIHMRVGFVGQDD